MPKKKRRFPNDWRKKVEARIKEWVSPEAFKNSLKILNRPEANEAAKALWALSSVDNENLPILYAKLLFRIAAARELAKNNTFNRTARQTKDIVKALTAVMDDGYFKEKFMNAEINRAIAYYGRISKDLDFIKLLPKTRPRERETSYAVLAICTELKSTTGRPQHKIASLLMNAGRFGDARWTEDAVKVRHTDYSYLRKSLAMYDLMTTSP